MNQQGTNIMCVSVAFTAGCTFGDVEEATKAAAANPVQVTEGCVSVLFTAGCSFGDVAEAQAAAQKHMDALGASKLGCVSTAWTAVCTV